eukprot:1372847-Prymnesium_polylepis.1
MAFDARARLQAVAKEEHRLDERRVERLERGERRLLLEIGALLPGVVAAAVAIPADEARKLALGAAAPDNLLERVLAVEIPHRACQQRERHTQDGSEQRGRARAQARVVALARDTPHPRTNTLSTHHDRSRGTVFSFETRGIAGTAQADRSMRVQGRDPATC